MDRTEHAEDCKSEECASDCGWLRFQQWLAEPVLPFEVTAAARWRERVERLNARLGTG